MKNIKTLNIDTILQRELKQDGYEIHQFKIRGQSKCRFISRDNLGSEEIILFLNFAMVSSVLNVDFFNKFISKGFSVAALDYPGLGLSDNNKNGFKAFDSLKGADHWASVDLCIQSIKQRYPKKRISIIAFSYGAALTYLNHSRLREEKSLKSVILCSPPFLSPSFLWLAATILSSAFVSLGFRTNFMISSRYLKRKTRIKDIYRWGDKKIIELLDDRLKKYPYLIQEGFSVGYIFNLCWKSILFWGHRLFVRSDFDFKLILAEKDKVSNNRFLKSWSKAHNVESSTIENSKHYLPFQAAKVQDQFVDIAFEYLKRTK